MTPNSRLPGSAPPMLTWSGGPLRSRFSKTALPHGGIISSEVAPAPYFRRVLRWRETALTALAFAARQRCIAISEWNPSPFSWQVFEDVERVVGNFLDRCRCRDVRAC